MAVAMVTGVATVGLVAPVQVARAASTASPVAVGARAGATRMSFGVSDELKASVDVGSGNLMVVSTDRSAPSINGMASFGLTYESLAAASGSQATSGAAGAGWFMPMGQDTRLIKADDGSLLFMAPNGSQGKFTPVSGSTTAYTAPAGFRQVLVRNSDNTWSMTDRVSRTVTKFGTDGRMISMSDRNGQVTSFTYTGGNVSAITLPTGQVLTVAFANGKLASITRPANGSLVAGAATYAYDSSGRLASITRPAVPGGAASAAKFTYSAAGDLASITDGLGNITQFVYDSGHRVTSVAQGKSGDLAMTRFVYSSATQTLVASPTSNQAVAPASTYHTTYTLDSSQRVTHVDDALHRTRDTKYTSDFDVSSQSNGLGGTASATYGSNGGPLTKATSAMGSSQSWTAGAAPNEFNPADSTDAQGNKSVMTYSNTGMPASTAANGGATSKVTYHGDGTVGSSTDPAGHVTTYTESASGKYISAITPPTGSGLGATTISGNPAVTVTNGAGQKTTYTYNDRYGLTSAATATQTVSYTYDANGRVTSRTDKNQKVTYGYNSRGNVTSITAAPVSGGTAPPASTVSYTYDLAGNMTSRTVAGSKTSYAYDQAQQLVAMTEPSGAVTRFAYNNAGQRTDTWWHTNTDHSTFVAHTHNVFGVGKNLTQTYTSVKSSDAAANRMSDYSYCYAKYVAGTACPSNTSSSKNTGLIQYMQNNVAGTVIQFGYDTQNRLTSASNWAGHNYVYTYDKVGNRTSTTVDGTRTQSLTFNADNEITSTGYAYDKAGRRTSDAKGGTATWNDLGQAVAQKNGTESGTMSYAGQGQNELIRQTNGSVAENFVWGRDNAAGIPQQEYITATGSEPTFVNNDNAGMPIDFVESTGTQYLMYSGTGSLIGTIDGTGANTSTYHLDPYGALLSITSGGNTKASQPASGVATPNTMAAQDQNLAAATPAASAAGGASPWATFGIQNTVSNYWKRGARWNDTYTGTWTSVDPITTLNDPNRANPYTYTSDNPINQTDPAGLFDWGTVGSTVGGAVGTAVAVGFCPATAGIGCAVAAGAAGGALGGVLGGQLGSGSEGDRDRVAGDALTGALGGAIGGIPIFRGIQSLK